MRGSVQIVGLAVLCGCAAIAVSWGDTAAAQARGQAVFTQVEPPANAGPAAFKRFLKKNRVTDLKPQPGKRSWRSHVFVHLRSAPAAATLRLPQNGGRLHLAFYRRVRRKWVRDNVDNVTYRPGVKIMRFPFRFTPSLGLTAGALYQLRVTLLDRRNREVVLAVGYFKLK